MKVRTIFAPLLLATFISACFAAENQGQPPAAENPLRLTLRDAVQLALRQNPQVQIAALTTAQTEEDRAIARSALFPQLTFEAFERVQRFNLQAFIGRSFAGSDQHAGPFATFQAGPLFAFPI